MPISDVRIIELPRIEERRGNLTFIESGRHIPFEIKRTYYLYDVPGGASRAAHGHKGLHQFMIAMSGSFDITLDDGFNKKLFHLNRSYYGLYIPPMLWRDLDNFSSGAVCMVLASEFYDEADYFRDYDDFLRAAHGSAQ
jgi:dTDP-4-dehydrorhamnose 3,5-epimerase-like enzyme